MGGAIAGPSSEDLGYVPHAERSEPGDGAPRDAPVRRPLWRWVSVAVVLALIALVVLWVAASWARSDRAALADQSLGSWVQSGSPGSALVIKKLAPGGDVRTGDLVFTGTVDGGEVRGVVTIPSFPSFSRTLKVSLLGRHWDLRVPRPLVMTLTSPSGQVITFRKA